MTCVIGKLAGEGLKTCKLSWFWCGKLSFKLETRKFLVNSKYRSPISVALDGPELWTTPIIYCARRDYLSPFTPAWHYRCLCRVLHCTDIVLPCTDIVMHGIIGYSRIPLSSADLYGCNCKSLFCDFGTLSARGLNLSIVRHCHHLYFSRRKDFLSGSLYTHCTCITNLNGTRDVVIKIIRLVYCSLPVFQFHSYCTVGHEP